MDTLHDPTRECIACLACTQHPHDRALLVRAILRGMEMAALLLADRARELRGAIQIPEDDREVSP